jgi:hypothetical protein
MHVEEQTLHGKWWLPGKPEKRIYGILEIESSGGSKITLSFDDEHSHTELFPHEDPQLVGQRFNIPRLTGRLYDGKLVSAEAVICLLGGYTNGIIKFDCFPSYICIPQLELGGSELMLDEIALELDGVDDFIFLSGIKSKHDHDVDENKKLTSFKVDASFELPNTLQLFKNNDLLLHANFGFNYKPTLSELSITQTTKLGLSSTKPRSLQEWWDDILSLNCFICIIYGQPIPLKSIKSVKKVGDNKNILDFVAYSEPLPDKNYVYSSGDLIFRRIDAADNIGRLIYHFMKLRSRYHLIFDAYFSSKFTNAQYLTTRFFLIVTALEGFHRQLRCDHNKQKSGLGLKTRMKELFSEFEGALNHEFDWNNLPSKIARYRNQEAHILNVEQQHNANEMNDITIVLHIVFTVLFLNEAANRCDFTIPSEWFQRGWLSQYTIIKKMS